MTGGMQCCSGCFAMWSGWPDNLRKNRRTIMKKKSSGSSFEFIDDRETEFAAILSQLDTDALNRMLDFAASIILSEKDEVEIDHRESETKRA